MGSGEGEAEADDPCSNWSGFSRREQFAELLVVDDRDVVTGVAEPLRLGELAGLGRPRSELAGVDATDHQQVHGFGDAGGAPASEGPRLAASARFMPGSDPVKQTVIP